MSRKIFVSYKHDDNSVKPQYGGDTARSYVDKLIELFEGNEIYKGEDDEDLGKFKDETIQTHLKEKIHDSSVTIVLISPGMKEEGVEENDQWIPWEISYSLKEIVRNDKTSKTNAILAIALPDWNSSYDYYLEQDTCYFCHCRTLHTHRLFQILRDNMFNINKPTYSDCVGNHTSRVYTGYSSYIYSVRWDDFISDMEGYIQISEDIRDSIKEYTIVKEIDRG